MLKYFVVISFVWSPYMVNGQKESMQYVRGENILFFENFFTINNLDAKFKLLEDKNVLKFPKKDDHYNLEWVQGKAPLLDIILTKQPQSTSYITFECSFVLEDTNFSTLSLLFLKEDFKYARYISIDKYWYEDGWYSQYDQISRRFLTPLHRWLPIKFDPGSEHHMAVCFTKKEVRTYLDDHLILGSPYSFWKLNEDRLSKSGFLPVGFRLAGFAPYKINYIVIAESINEPEINLFHEFDRIITEEKIVTHNINFDVNRASIRTESYEYIKQLSLWLKEKKNVKIEVVGHTDSDGNASNNLKLSFQRAETVKNKLVELGIAPSRLTAKGYGATRPIQTNGTYKGKAENRRVEFINITNIAKPK